MAAVTVLTGIVGSSLVLFGIALLIARMIAGRRANAHDALMFAVLDRLVDDEPPVEVPGFDSTGGISATGRAA